MWRFSLLVAMLLLAGGCWAEDVLYRTQQAVELGSARTDIRLQSKSPAAFDLSDHKSGDPLVLVLSGVWASKAPSAGYHLYLNVPLGLRPQVSDPGHLGEVSFYGAPEHYSHENPKEVAFFLDDALVRLRAAGRLAGAPSLTLVPVRPERPGAQARIEEISIIAIPR